MRTWVAIAVLLLAEGAPGDQTGPTGVTLKQPKRVKYVAPEYPSEAARSGLQQVVILECAIGPDGSVKDVKALRGDPPLTDAAVAGVKKWRYEPLRLDGKPTPFIMTITVNFGRIRQVTVDRLCQSLGSRYEAVRESAAMLLGEARTGGRIGPGDMAQARRALASLLEQEQSERVRKAAEQALARLETP